MATIAALPQTLSTLASAVTEAADSLPEFADPAALIRAHASRAPHRPALIVDGQVLDYAALDARMDRVVAALWREGLKAGDVVALCASNSLDDATAFLGVLRAGMVVAPLAQGLAPAALLRMVRDADARLLLASREVIASLIAEGSDVASVALDEGLDPWLEGTQGARPDAPFIDPAAPFNIIYSSGTTGEPKGIVQPHAMRWAYARRAHRFGYGDDTVTLLSTPLYSNTTLVVFFPTLAFGGTVVLQPRFDAAAWLALAQRHRVTHTMLVPVQYDRLLAHAAFDATDLSSFRYKFSTSAPFAAARKADVLRRWPGALVEFYGLTEGGGSCILDATLHPDKLHTVGRPAPGHEIRLIDEQGLELPRDALGVPGEVVGRSPSMMTGYHKKPQATREAEWFDAQGRRFLRTGDVGHFDADGFLTLVDRRKDVVISGGFNIYPSDLEAVLREHPQVDEATVVGVPSKQWGETPVAFVVPRRAKGDESAAMVLAWANERLGKMQRLHDLCFVDALPRNAIGKVLKRELREVYVSTP